MTTRKINGQDVKIHRFNTVVVGAGAAGMNCAKKLYEYMDQNGVDNPQERIAVVTAGKALGASRMSGSDKQTYYKMGTSPDVADSAESFAKSLTAGGCCHADLALAEGIGSLRGFYNLVEAGVPFPSDSMGIYVGYKTDHDPYERATSAGPKTSKFMSECLEKIITRYGITIYDHQEAVEFITRGEGDNKRILGLITINKKQLHGDNLGLSVFLADNFVLAAGGPGALYKTSVYPKGQTGMHGIAFKAGLAAENFTESQFGLASIKFRWNVSGTYMQAIPRIFSTDAEGNDEREFLTGFFPSMSRMATDIFLKGYQWPFDPQRIENYQSSLIDVVVFNETQKGRRVFMDFLRNPVGNLGMDEFRFEDLGPEALDYLKAASALQSLPIERLEHMNSPAIDIYKEHDIDLYSEPLEIAVCAQHNNGGFAINKWWESNIRHTFVIGEMAGSHGVKRPGGSALNAGQVGAQRAAEFIVNAYGSDITVPDDVDKEIAAAIKSLDILRGSGPAPVEAIKQIQQRMTAFGGHIRKLANVRKAFKEALELFQSIQLCGLAVNNESSLITAVQARHISLACVASLKAVMDLLEAGSGSRGSHLVLAGDGIEVHPDIKDPDTGETLRFKPENLKLRDSVMRIVFDPANENFFTSETVPVRMAPSERKAFEPAWADYRNGRIYS
ncbi:succinate dehydrogenase flavoprotein subunit [Limihaloglobus sulfuriphilus]|uniref:Succinate dehydrogenase flavoprotein subunit n=1 Tax=Limihaloglobus sulfuriphilus TaxID=1851148 RepID=A0A1Q2ME68_9BACT|nr:FAD-binding protein [Limihaloglobus sulfuriphilus]AQQ70960.1 succinate dehydrogenase flavoprotein subunit [Limihaloglobus sulfuriphilus]